MKWFEEIFIPSLVKRMQDKDMKDWCWITEKQVDVCLRYMKQSRYFDFYYIAIGDFEYKLSVMKKGYGKLTRCDKNTSFH